ncbi:SDR family NAD(P)-dependent oxidoreductase [Nocardia africana]|uniref:SDR family NAD(P)-dependent oxidoreductase n=1 Tax=Nocardia africana TaxID=134964 RepID=A0ABW6NQW2_9NOCA
MSCRMPGAADLDAEFDANFFGISPDEVQAIGSRHLSALELGWEALENAGVVAGVLDGLRCGVFVSGAEQHSIAERMSAHFGFEGPSVVVDDARTSSSLVAVRLAYESLRSGDSDLALAGGAPDSGEGGGMVVLKPLARAIADADRIHAVLREGAVDDGSRAPSAPGIASLIEAVSSLSHTESVAGPGHTDLGLIVAPPPADESVAPAGGTVAVVPWVVSARNESGVRAQAARLREWLMRHPELDAVDVAYSLLTTRAQMPWRGGVVGRDRAELLAGLAALADPAAPAPAIDPITGRAERRRIAFVFPGNGSQWEGMALGLLDSDRAFAESIAECEAALAPYVDWSLTAVLRRDADAPAPATADVVQPVLFAVMVSLARMWQAAGVEPDVVVGHSHGEVAAAHIAGGLSLADAARVVALRSRAIADELVAQGGMASVGLDAGAVRERLSTYGDRLVLAAINGPSQSVVSGEVQALEEFLADCARERVRARRVAIDYASHSPAIERIRERLLAELAPIRPRSGSVPYFSPVVADRVDTAELDAEYWYRSERESIRFADTVAALIDAGITGFIEVGPHPVLAMGIARTAEAVGADGLSVIGSLRRGAGDRARFLASLVQAYCDGVPVDPAVLVPAGARIELPPYAFQRRSIRTDAPLRSAGSDAAAPISAGGAAADDSPLARILLAAPEFQRAAIALDIVREHAAAVLGHDSARTIRPDLPFTDLGFDSVTGLELQNRLKRVTGVALPASLVFDHPTANAVAALLHARVTGIDRGTHRATRRTSTDEPIAIVGIGARFPGGVRSGEDLWDLTVAGRDVIGDFPTDRGWDLERLFDPDPGKPGTVYTRRGGFLGDAGDFDPEFFGISPREATAMDPQQRLFLETSWEALEDAGIDPTSLRGSDTAVFVGACSSGYSRRVTGELEGCRLTGTSHSVVSGRVAYVLGLEGPAVTVDTACSSSLVALHLACRALRQGETSLVLAGGVTVAASPSLFVDFARQRGLSPDGRCKAFSADADGVVWSEGSGVLVLERLSDARRLGHHVLAVVRGSAVNQDGASNGLTAPNGPSQERVIAQALADAGISATEVDAVEAHGTGTRLGDPIEAQALIAVYGQGRDAREPVRIGSVKSNIGHTVAAAGVAGVIKMVQALRHERLPRTLYAETPSPHVDWSAGAARLLTEAEPWAAGDRVRRAGVSSFGISGTNAHLILEEAPAAAPVAAEDDHAAPLPVVPLLVSGKGEAGLRAQAARLWAWLSERPELDIADAAYALATSRAQLESRRVILGRDRDEVLARLANVAESGTGTGVVEGVAGSGRTAFLFTGQGAQRVGMGSGLYQAFPVFAAALDEVCAHVDPLLGRSLRELMFTDAEGVLDRTEFTQPALFAFEVALYRLLESFGLTADVLIGHSIGEVAAAYLAGLWSTADACRLVAARGRLMGALPPGGAMLAVAAAEPDVNEVVARYSGRVSVAAVNAPEALVVSGAEAAVAEIEALFVRRGCKTSRLRVGHAFHSALMEPMLDEFAAVAAELTYNRPRLPVVSNLSGLLAADELLEPSYWVRHVRDAVRFAPGIETLIDSGVRRFVEVGPDAVLTALTRQTLGESADAVVMAAARRDHDEAVQLSTMVAQAHTSGARVDWTALIRRRPRRRIPLPTYAFQRRRFWLPDAAESADVRSAGLDRTDHPLVGAAVWLPDADGVVLAGRLSLSSHPWLADHVIGGSVVVPGTAFVELALHAGAMVGCPRTADLIVTAPLIVPATGAVELRVTVSGPDAGDSRQLTVHSRPQHDGEAERAEWVRHATGTLVAQAPSSPAHQPDTRPPAAAQPVPIDDAYTELAGRGYDYGPAFRGLTALWRHNGEVFAELTLPEQAQSPDGRTTEYPSAGRFGVHPALLDAVLHALLAAGLVDAPAPDTILVPYSWENIDIRAVGATSLRARLAVADAGGVDRRITVSLTDSHGAPVVEIGAVTMRPIPVGALGDAAADRSGLYRIDWQPARPDSVGPSASALAALSGANIAGIPETYTSLAEIGVADDLPAAVVWRAPVHIVGDPAAADPGPVRAGVHTTLAMLRSWLAAERVSDLRLVVVTTGGAGPVGTGTNPAAAAVWGSVRSAQSEHPDRFVLIDEDPAEPLSADRVAAVLHSGEPQVAVRDGQILVPRLTRASGPAENPPTPLADATVLITGGTGGLGAVFARHLVIAHDVRRLVLTSRRGHEAPGAAGLVRELTRAGADARVVACDVADRDAIRDLLGTIAADDRLAVIHTAGVLDDGTVESLTAEQVDRVLAPKVDGAWHLHELTRDRDVSAFVLFSSIAGSLGSAGQSNYAAANGYLDALARQRQDAGLTATALAWGPWRQDGGMTGDLDRAAVARWERMGFGQLDDAEGVRLFDQALARPEAQLAPIRFDATAVRRQTDVAAVPAVLRGFARRVSAPAARIPGSLGARLAAAPDARRAELVLDLVREHAAAVLGYTSPGEVDVDKPFSGMGLDSLGGVEFRNRLGKATGVRLPSTLVFDHPTPAAVATFVRSLVEPKTADGSAGASVDRGATPMRADEAIAIVGMACRYPGGVGSPDQLWDLLISETDAISEFPADRGWDLERLFDPDPEHSGTSYIREGGFLTGAGDFDAGFFGIGPREASAMDPQQRLLLEVAWEALEDAGIDPASLRGSDTGVYTGVMYQDYAEVTRKAGAEVEGYAVTGVMGSVASGRVSYALGLEGPALTVDTACSSSLVALHTACRALRQGESSLALVGGATVMATPMVFVEFSRQRGLARDARCKSFSAAADGITWSEGAAMLVVERLSDARRLGHDVLAVVRGSAVNQDGASNGLTAPNGPSQERVIMAALADAGLTSSDVDALEAHGTGTPLGDPIEANAVLATYGQRRSQPLLLGSLKSNIGHAQAAAGVGGVIKMVQALRHRMLPRTLHVDEPSPHVDWSAGAVELLTEARPWQDSGRVRRAGVSSFGISGTNAHVILEQAPAPAGASGSRPGPDQPRSVDAGRTVTWVVSAQSREALREQAVRLAQWVGAHPDAKPGDIAHSLLRHRSQLEWRAAVVAREPADLAAGLARLAESGSGADGVVSGRAVARRAAFVFPGQGSQWVGMAAELLAAGGVFAEAIAECEAALAPFVEWSLTAVLRGEPGAAALERVDVVQPALFAVMVSLARLWRANGVEPVAVLGHSQGEIAAAVVAGGLSTADGARVVALRSRIVAEELAGHGGMASVRATTEAVRQRMAGFGDRISVAAENGPGETVVSGEASAVDEFVAACAADGVWVRRIPVDYASHSAAVEAIRDRVTAELSAVEPKPGALPFFSTVSADYVDTELLDAGYWYRGLRAPVRFAESVAALARAGVNAFIEVSPHPVLTVGMTSTVESLGMADRVAVFGTLQRDRGGPEQVAVALAQAHCAGVAVAPAALAAHADRVALPTYAFEHRRYWLRPGVTPDVRQSGLAEAGHPLLGAMLRLPDSSDVVFTARLSTADQPWLADHAVAGVALLPGAALVELALHVGTLLATPRVAELVLEAPLPVPATGAVELRVMAGGPDESGARPVSVYSRAHDADESEEWTRHAVGSLTAQTDTPSAGPETAAWPPAGAIAMPVADAYAVLAERGYEYGPVFQGLTALWRRDDEVFAEVALPETARPHGGEFGIHPALLDAALHAILLGDVLADAGADAVVVPFSWENVELYATGATSLRVRAARSGSDRVAVSVTDAAGAVVAEVAALTLRQLPIDTLVGAARHRNDGAGYRVEWVAVPSPDEPGDVDSQRPGQDEDIVTVAGRRVTVVRFDPARWASGGAADLPAAVRDSVTELTVRMQRLLARDEPIVVVTHRAVATHPGESVDLSAAAAWGLLRTAQSEHADRILVVDVDERDDYRRAVAVAMATGDEPQLALRRGALYAPRLGRGPGDLVGASELIRSRAWRLAHSGTGTLTGDNLAVVETPEELRELAPGQVRIALRAAGVNFRDVLITLGMVSDATAGSQSISATICVEGAGVVLEVAPDVTEFSPGDRVFGFTSGAGSVTVTDRRLLARMPHGWSFAQAAAVPVVYATAYYGLVDLAGAQPGRTLLLHAATGGVGLAAIQLARHLGLRVLPTTSRPKWDVLRALGFDDSEIGDSRTLDFEQKFVDATAGRGVDIVLNSLTLDFVDASLRLMPHGGKFIEMGHLDERDPGQVAADHPGVDYHHFMLLDVPPDRLGQILQTVVELFDAGDLTPSQITAWDLRQAPEAFRHMSQARHIGKNVLTVPAPLRPEGTVLITGGTGGLGAVVARQLITDYGVRRLVLAGRRGPAAPGAAELRDDLAALGAEIEVVACDAADRAALDRVLAAVPADHPLTGVVHAAGVLSDGLLATMTPERIAEVLRPKVDAAWNLHEATKDLDLSMFVLYSSIAGVIGNPGQANYAAANVFLDALAQYRHVHGLPATSIAWGLWAESTGMTGALGTADIARLRRDGFPPLDLDDGVALFDAAVASGRADVAAVRIDRSALAADGRSIMRGLVRPVRRRATAAAVSESSTLAALVAGRTPAEQERVVLEVIRTQAAAVLGHDDVGSIAPDMPFKDIGFDSLSVMEFRNQLVRATGLQLPATLVFDYPTAEDLAGFVYRQIAPAQDPAERIAAEIDALTRSCAAAELSPEDRSDVARRLTALLRQLEDGAAVDSGPDLAVDRLDTADDRELFDFIDNLG